MNAIQPVIGIGTRVKLEVGPWRSYGVVRSIIAANRIGVEWDDKPGKVETENADELIVC